MISAGKMSGLWSGDPASIKLSDLDVICAVLGCGVEELLIPEPDKVSSGPGNRRARPTAALAPADRHHGDPRARARRAISSPRLDEARRASSCADCLAWGVPRLRSLRVVLGLAEQAPRRGRVRRAAGGSWRSRTVY